MSEHRIEKIESLIHQVLGEMIQREFTPPEGALVSLTRIAVSGNLQEAKVYISVIPDRLGNEVVGNLQKNAWRFQEELNKKLKMRPVPKIIFAADRQAAGDAGDLQAAGTQHLAGVVGGGLALVQDEIRVLGRHHRAADAQPRFPAYAVVRRARRRLRAPSTHHVRRVVPDSA